MSEVHQEMHVAQLCIRQETDFPHGPIRIGRPREEENWWDVTLAIVVQDGQPINVTVIEVKKSP